MYLGVGSPGFSGCLINIVVYASRHKLGRLLPVELMNMTTPEDHLRRYMLTHEIAKKMSIGDLSHEFSKRVKLTPKRQQNIQSSMLPILLCSYAERSQRQLIRELCDLQAEVNLGDYDGRRALHLAACENQIPIAKLLLMNNADLNIQDNYGSTPLWDSLVHGNWEMAKYLYSLKGNLGNQKNRSRTIASKLCFFVHRNEMESLKMWVECGAKIDAQDYDGRTALHVAQSQQNEDATRILTAHGADLTVSDRWGTSTGASDFNLRSMSLGDVAHEYTSIFEDVRPVHIKLDKDLLVLCIMSLLDSNDETRKTALLPSLACEVVCTGDVQVLSQLIYKGLDVSKGDYDRRTPLHLACATGSLTSVRKLVWNSADVNAIDRFGYSPLFEALQHGHDDVCEYLRANGAQLGLTYDRSASILCWAAYNDDINNMQRLVENGIDATAADYDGRRCFDVATDRGFKKMVEYLTTIVDDHVWVENVVMDLLEDDDDDVFEDDPNETTDGGGFDGWVDDFNEGTPLLKKKLLKKNT